MELIKENNTESLFSRLLVVKLWNDWAVGGWRRICVRAAPAKEIIWEISTESSEFALKKDYVFNID